MITLVIITRWFKPQSKMIKFSYNYMSMSLLSLYDVRFVSLVLLSLSFRFLTLLDFSDHVSVETHHTSDWWLTLIPNVTILATENNNSLVPNHSKNYLSSAIIISVHVSYIFNYNFIFIRYKTIKVLEY